MDSESFWLSSDFHSQSIIKCDLSEAAIFTYHLSASVAIACKNNAAWEIIMKTDCSYFAGKSGVLYFRTTIQRQEWTPFILGAEDLKKTKTKLIRSTGKKKLKTSVLCELSLPEAMSEKSPLSTVSCGCHSRCAVSSQARLSLNETMNLYNVANRPGLPRSPTHWATSVAPRFNTGFQTLRTPKKKKKVGNPPPSRIF